MKELPLIPVIDARAGGPLLAARAAEPQMRELLRHARRLVSAPVLVLADRVARRWLARTENPYLSEIDAIAAFATCSGAYALNTSYEWCCTCGVGGDPEGGVRLLRVLDWRQSGLGRALIVVWQRAPRATSPISLGPVLSVSSRRWPLAALPWRSTSRQ
jgi:hypothetical protein